MSVSNVAAAQLGSLYTANPLDVGTSASSASQTGSVTGTGASATIDPTLGTILETLQQLGIGPGQAGNAPVQSGTQTIHPHHHPRHSGAGNDAMYGFLYALGQAAASSNTAATSGTADSGVSASSGTAGYTSASSLQNLIASLGNGSDSSNPTLGDLQTAYQNLTGNSSASTPSLQTFLQTLEQNLAGGGGTTTSLLASSGSLLSAVA